MVGKVAVLLYPRSELSFPSRIPSVMHVSVKIVRLQSLIRREVIQSQIASILFVRNRALSRKLLGSDVVCRLTLSRWWFCSVCPCGALQVGHAENSSWGSPLVVLDS